MGTLNRRISKLEAIHPTNDVCIQFICREDDDEATRDIALKSAIADWEKINGPLGNTEPNIIVRIILS